MVVRIWRGQAAAGNALTFWESLGSIRSFAGDDVACAIVEPEARAVLSGFDDVARHYELAFRMDRPA